jgi:hypothetical protein
MHRFIVGAALTALISGGTAAIAQHNHSHSGAPSHAAHGSDTRELVKFPPRLAEHTLANMRDHLAALQEIQEHLGMGNPDVAARIAEKRLGMSSLGDHGAHEVAKYMPQGMQDAGTAMHRSASQFAIVATDSAVTGDLKPVFSALAKLTGTCVGCHAGYRLK